MLRYSPGAWHALVTPGAVAMLAPDLPLEVVDTMWTTLSTSGRGLGTVLEGLVGSFGTSLSSLPPFAVVSVDGDTGEARVIVRGPVQAAVLLADGRSEQISGLGVTTWNERVVTDAVTVELIVPGAQVTSLAIRDGVVLASAIRWRLVEGGLSASVQTQDDPLPAAPDEPAIAVGVTASTENLEIKTETVVPELDATFAPIDPPTAEEAPSDEEHTRGYEDLIFGETRISTVEDAAVRVDDGHLISGIPSGNVIAPLTSSAAASEAPGDHDGETISLAQLAEIQARLGDMGDRSESVPSAVGTVWPTLVVSSGERLTLDRGAVVGRRPRAVRATGVLPHLVTVASPNQDVSRSHVEVRVEGRDVVVVDLDTTNGTELRRVGADPFRLQPSDPTLIVAGDTLDLGDGIVLSFEGLS